ncbi:MAG: DNA adenine methylase [Nostoc sp.]
MQVQQTFTPPLKWAGGKRWLVSIVQEIWDKQEYTRLVEPFVGGMAISLGILPVKASINDINPHLINFYRWLQKGLVIELELKNDSEYYYTCREEFNNLIKSGESNSQKAAELFYFLNKQGYNGLCRFNSKGEFNVPFGDYKKVNGARDLSQYANIVNNWKFSCGDFTKVIIQERDFIYADPPYDVEFTKYSKEDFKWSDQVRLATWLASCPATVVASNQATARIVDLYEKLGFKIKFLDAPRRISCTGDRKPAKEILVYKY